MIPTLLVAVAALAIVAAPMAGAPQACAQPARVEAEQAKAAVTFTPEERDAVSDWIKRQRPIAARKGIAVGVMLPDDVETYPVPEGWGPSAARYRYFHSGEKVYFVEPSTRRVVYVFD